MTNKNNLVELTEVKCYKVKALATGKELPMMVVSSEWNGLQELRTIDGKPDQMLIIASSEFDGLAGRVRVLLGGNPVTAVVLKGSPDLLAKLQEQPAGDHLQSHSSETGPGGQSS